MAFVSVETIAGASIAGRADPQMDKAQRVLTREMGRINLFCNMFNEAAIKAEAAMRADPDQSRE